MSDLPRGGAIQSCVGVARGHRLAGEFFPRGAHVCIHSGMRTRRAGPGRSTLRWHRRKRKNAYSRSLGTYHLPHTRVYHHVANRTCFAVPVCPAEEYKISGLQPSPARASSHPYLAASRDSFVLGSRVPWKTRKFGSCGGGLEKARAVVPVGAGAVAAEAVHRTICLDQLGGG